jgi:hypothetical protein
MSMKMKLLGCGFECSVEVNWSEDPESGTDEDDEWECELVSASLPGFQQLRCHFNKFFDAGILGGERKRHAFLFGRQLDSASGMQHALPDSDTNDRCCASAR